MSHYIFPLRNSSSFSFKIVFSRDQQKRFVKDFGSWEFTSGEKTEEKSFSLENFPPILPQETCLSMESFDIKNSPSFIINIINITTMGGMSWRKSCRSWNSEEHGEETLPKWWFILSEIGQEKKEDKEIKNPAKQISEGLETGTG